MKIEKSGKMPTFVGFCKLCRAWVNVSYGDDEYKIFAGDLSDPFISVWCPTEGCPCKIFLKPSYPEDYKSYNLDP